MITDSNSEDRLDMSTVQEIEAAIRQLEPKKIHAVADWLMEYREELWDKQIAADAKAGKLDSLIMKAKADHRAGKATPFPSPHNGYERLLRGF
jgi:cell division inhibitor SulA